MYPIEKWSRGSKFTATEPPAPRPEVVRKESAPAPAPRAELEQTNWRSSKPVSKDPTRESGAGDRSRLGVKAYRSFHMQPRHRLRLRLTPPELSLR